MANREIEIKVKIEKYQKLIAFLQKKAQFVSKKHQVDEYFTPQHRNFLSPRPVKEWLRLRKSKDEFYITYKKWHYTKSGRTHYGEEQEVQIGNLERLREILKALNFESVVTVDKQRQVWTHQNWEICLDEVKGLGNFVEIESKGKSTKKPAEITKEMISFLKEIGCGEIERSYDSYPFQLLFPKEIKFEKQ
ncbi:class IV adenylate cyclase [Patescibacteria group bacterium]